MSLDAMPFAPPCDHHELPLVDGWHVRKDPEGWEGTQRIPCPLATVVPTPPRHRHEWEPRWVGLGTDEAHLATGCRRCTAIRDEAKARRGRNSRKRGNAAELDAARIVGGRKMGPLGLPWDVEMPGYARLQVRKYVRPESLPKIAAELARIGSGAEMPGYVWIQPGRGGERLIVFRLADFAERHGVKVE